jgi:uncharacterized protein (DUF488 family)
MPEERVIHTVGHSTHPLGRFLELLGANRIAALADVRSFPSSRRWPHFNRDELARAMEGAGIEYRWMKSLGGRRHQLTPGSPHTAWTTPAFHAYADYAETAGFEAGLAELIELARAKPTAYMCSEGLWWRCHRRIISDHLVVRGWTVVHILPDGKLSPHQLPRFARVDNGRIIYDRATF